MRTILHVMKPRYYILYVGSRFRENMKLYFIFECQTSHQWLLPRFLRLPQGSSRFVCSGSSSEYSLCCCRLLLILAFLKQWPALQPAASETHVCVYATLFCQQFVKWTLQKLLPDLWGLVPQPQHARHFRRSAFSHPPWCYAYWSLTRRSLK